MRLLITTQAVDMEDPALGFFHAWILEFAKHFERIDVMCLREGVHELPPHVHVHSLGKEEGENRLKYLVRFYRHFFSCYMLQHVDYVFFHMGAIYNILAAPFFLVRKIRRTQFFWWKTHGKMTHLKERLALRFTDTVLTAGQHSFGITSEKVRVVGHAVDAEYFKPTEHSARGAAACLMVGRIVPIKKIEVAIAAVEKIKSDISNLTLTIVGKPDSGGYQKNLSTYVREHGLSQVAFAGPCTHAEMKVHYDRSNILIHPAYEAGFDKVVLEAMAAGVVPITSILSYKPILDGYGLYVPPEDVDGYVAAIRRITSLTPAEREKLAENLREVVVKNHSLSTLPARIFGV